MTKPSLADMSSEELALEFKNAECALDYSDDHRVLRRFTPVDRYPGAAAYTDAELKAGLYVDVETTSLDTETAEIIELAIVPFTYDAEGRVHEVRGYSWLNEPQGPIGPEITALTGISFETVAGHHIDKSAVRAFIDTGVGITIAHNATFDRKVLEREFPEFRDVDWGCSYTDVAWKKFGSPCARLTHLLMETCDQFYDAHRALDDCRVGVHVLTSTVFEGRTALAHLLEAATRRTAQVWAIGAEFAVKDKLKARGYRWNPGDDGRAKAWFTTIDSADVEAEEVWLRAHTHVFRPRVKEITARERFSVRE